MKNFKFIVLLVITILIYTSCQQIFTYSALEWAQRDPSNLPPAQQVAYAESALASGDNEAIINAYNAIKDLDTAEADLLASELAFAGSGVGSVMDEAATMLLDGTGDPMDLLDSLNPDLLQGSADEFESALGNDAVPNEEQFVNAAASLVLVNSIASDIDTVMADLADVDDGTVTTPLVDDPFDPLWTDSQKTYYYVLKAGYTDLADLENLI